MVSSHRHRHRFILEPSERCRHIRLNQSRQVRQAGWGDFECEQGDGGLSRRAQCSECISAIRLDCRSEAPELLGY